MNFKAKKRLIKLLIIFLIFISQIKCDLFWEKEFELFRIIDNLSQENIVESPLKDLFKKFNFVESDISGMWKFIPDLSNKDIEVWGISIAPPILGDHNSERPEGMKLLRNGKEVKYLNHSSKSNKGWRWISTDETIDLKNYRDFNKKLNGFVLKEGDSFSFERLLPDGKILIQMNLDNKNWKNYKPILKISFNDKDFEEIHVGKKKVFKIRNSITLGTHKIEIKFPGGEQLPEKKKKFVVIREIKLKISSDILLLSKSLGKKTEPPQGKYQFTYYTHEALPERGIPGVSPEILSLYHMKNTYLIHDEGIKHNPFMIKKKIIKDEFSLNAIIAPPKSEFLIPCKIPPGGILEFGYGFLNEFERGNEGSTERIINFKIILKNSEEEKTLLQRSLSTAIQKEDILSEKMDLSSYEGKKVKLSFITEEASSGRSVDLIGIPVWINPVIYRRPEKDKTNIILISIDTLRPDHLGCYGYERNTSPHTDRLANDGVLFSNTFSTTSWTLPAHISLLASQDSLTHQVYYPNQKMNSNTTTLADILRMEGYYCAAFTGGAYLSTNYGFSKGFDSYHEIISKGSKPIRLDEAEHLARLSCDWLDKNKDKKFFLFLHTYQPHGPYSNNSPLGKVFLTEHSQWDKVAVGPHIEGKGRYITEFSEEEKKNIVDLYDGEIRYTDEALIKPLVDKLKELNMYDNTMVIFTSDHGEEFYDHEAWLHDHSIYNEGIKIPLIIKFPNYHHKGKKIDYITRITDIMPTILAQLKIQTSTLRLDGKSLLPLIEGKEKKDRIFISDLAFRDINIKIYPALISINNESLKLILNKKEKSPYTIRNSKNFNGKKIELYDIRKDPKETKNLALHKKYQEICAKLLKKIDELYENGEKERKEGEEARLNKKLKERLRALGYIK